MKLRVGSSPLKCYWWSPRRHLTSFRTEFHENRSAWFTLRRHGGKLFENFGDELSRDIIEIVSGKRVCWSPPKQCEIVGIGSILEFYVNCGGRDAFVYGSGLRGPDFDALALADDGGPIRDHLGSVSAVRGELTRAGLGLPRSTSLGDPGVFASELLPRRFRSRKGVGFLPHFRSWSDKRLIGGARKRDLKIVNPTLSPREVIEEVAQLDLLVSSSLHGIVVAHSLGIPCVPLILAGEPQYKYRDYFSSIGLNFSPIDEVQFSILSMASGRVATAVDESKPAADSTERIKTDLARAWRDFG